MSIGSGWSEKRFQLDTAAHSHMRVHSLTPTHEEKDGTRKREFDFRIKSEAHRPAPVASRQEQLASQAAAPEEDAAAAA